MSDIILNSYPLWFTDEFIKNIVEKYLKVNCSSVTNCNLGYLCGKGENYASIMYRLTINLRKDDQPTVLHCVVKTEINDGDLLAETNVFSQEIIAYEEILPKCLEVLKTPIKLAPELILSDSKQKIIVLENIQELGYKIHCRKDRLDEDQAKLVLKNLAQFHAATMIINSKNMFNCEQFHFGLINIKNKTIGRFYETNMKALIDRLILMGPLYHEFAEKCKRLLPRIITLAIDLVYPEEKELSCLNHGDLWSANILFKYNDLHNVMDAIFVDFQFICWTSPTWDLHYFFNTSLKSELQRYHVDHLLEFYYTHFQSALLNLEYDGHVPELQEFRETYYKKYLLSFIFALLSQPISILDGQAESEADMSALVEDNEKSRKFKFNVYKNPIVIDNIKHFIPIFDQMGVLDL